MMHDALDWFELFGYWYYDDYIEKILRIIHFLFVD